VKPLNKSIAIKLDFKCKRKRENKWIVRSCRNNEENKKRKCNCSIFRGLQFKSQVISRPWQKLFYLKTFESSSNSNRFFFPFILMFHGWVISWGLYENFHSFYLTVCCLFGKGWVCSSFQNRFAEKNYGTCVQCPFCV
jgi:hypothetical protein